MSQLPALEASILLLLEPVLNPIWAWLVRIFPRSHAPASEVVNTWRQWEEAGGESATGPTDLVHLHVVVDCVFAGVTLRSINPTLQPSPDVPFNGMANGYGLLNSIATYPKGLMPNVVGPLWRLA